MHWIKRTGKDKELDLHLYPVSPQFCSVSLLGIAARFSVKLHLFSRVLTSSPSISVRRRGRLCG